MILNLNKDFFLGSIIWYLMINCILCASLGLMGSERSNKYSTVDNLLLASLCFCWVIA